MNLYAVFMPSFFSIRKSVGFVAKMGLVADFMRVGAFFFLLFAFKI